MYQVSCSSSSVLFDQSIERGGGAARVEAHRQHQRRGTFRAAATQRGFSSAQADLVAHAHVEDPASRRLTQAAMLLTGAARSTSSEAALPEWVPDAMWLNCLPSRAVGAFATHRALRARQRVARWYDHDALERLALEGEGRARRL